MSNFSSFSKRYLSQIFRLFPSFATYMGRHESDHLLESFSHEAREETLRVLKALARERSTFRVKELSHREQIDFELMGVDLFSRIIDLEERKTWEIDPGTYVELAIFSAYFLIGRGNLPWEERACSLLSRMKLFSRIFQEAKSNLKNPPLMFTQSALEVTKGGLSFFKELNLDQLPLANSLKLEIERQKVNVLEGFQSYHRWLERELLFSSKGNYAVGVDLFNRLLKKQHLLPYSADDLHEIGKENFEATMQKMRKLAKQIDPHRSWKEILEKKAKDHPHITELLSVYIESVKKAKDFLKEKRLVPFPAQDQIIVTETPSFNRTFLPFAAYMPPPPFEKKGRGEFWVTPVDSRLPFKQIQLCLQEHAYHKIPLTVVHEAYPGHHLQFSFVKELSSPLAQCASSSVSCEGWAFYCEEMMKEEGYYRNPLIELCQLRDQLWRAGRVILDVALHTRKMSAQKGVSLLTQKVLFPEAMAWSEVKRYVREATQPMSYFIGKWEILKLRDAYKKKCREKFKLSEFHGRFLSCGVIPIKLAAKEILAQI